MDTSNHKKNMSPASLANLRKGNPKGTNCGNSQPTKEARAKASEAFWERIDLYTEIVDKHREGDPSIKPHDAMEAMSYLAKYAGLDIQRIAHTDTDGNNLPDMLDDEALDALLEARRQELMN